MRWPQNNGPRGLSSIRSAWMAQKCPGFPTLSCWNVRLSIRLVANIGGKAPEDWTHSKTLAHLPRACKPREASWSAAVLRRFRARRTSTSHTACVARAIRHPSFPREPFKKYCSHAVGTRQKAVFLGYGCVSAQSQDVSNLLLRQNFALTQNPRSARPQYFLKGSRR
jgi:hypothetical protein